ncbi:MAG: cohesin domain-containing protein [Candidatus Zixiibacteriota bacterium]
MRYFEVLLLIVVFTIVGDPLLAQTDNFGAVDNVYIDSLTAYPGQDVNVRVNLRNDELLSSLAVPLAYDTSTLSLTAISFVGSRCEYIQSKIISPSSVPAIVGHFVVSVVKLAEAPVPVGDGMIFTLQFRVSSSAVPGQVLVIDSQFMAPGGELVLTENTTSTSIRPAFKAGKIVVIPVNRAPQFVPSLEPTVAEGDSLKFSIQTTDPDLDNLTLTCLTKPTGAVFTPGTNGSGLLTWMPDFLGPNSSAGSPFRCTFRVSDGALSVDKDVFVTVTNKNRNPVITAPLSQSVKAGQNLSFGLSVYEPDFESVTWLVLNQPSGSTLTGSNPATFSWTPGITDSGLKTVDFVVSDPGGLTDTARVQIQVERATLYTLSLDTVAVDPGQLVDVTVLLQNELPVSAFNLLISYDPAVLTFMTATKTGTRVEYFESYTVTNNDGGFAGRLRIIGSAAAVGVGTPLGVGTGSVTTISFRAANSIDYAGMGIPVRFVFFDTPVYNDNTMKDSVGVKIPQTGIAYTNGLVMINSIGVVRIGDINLNGIPFEIADAVNFTNHFMNPTAYPFDALQFANSDVNGDGYVATVADLVRLINVIVQGLEALKPVETSPLEARVCCSAGADACVLSYDASFAVGAIYLEYQGSADLVSQFPAISNMTTEVRQDGSVTRVLIYSLEGHAMPAGMHDILSMAGVSLSEITRVDMAGADGRYVNVTMSSGTSNVPSTFVLGQNYPNPFNPETTISFALPQSGRITLTVFDLLGRTVRTVADGDYAAGNHTVVWDGRDERGESVGSGVYFYRLETPAGNETRKMMLLK